jgi:hypothetical protein
LVIEWARRCKGNRGATRYNFQKSSVGWAKKLHRTPFSSYKQVWKVIEDNIFAGCFTRVPKLGKENNYNNIKFGQNNLQIDVMTYFSP